MRPLSTCRTELEARERPRSTRLTALRWLTLLTPSLAVYGIVDGHCFSGYGASWARALLACLAYAALMLWWALSNARFQVLLSNQSSLTRRLATLTAMITPALVATDHPIAPPAIALGTLWLWLASTRRPLFSALACLMICGGTAIVLELVLAVIYLEPSLHENRLLFPVAWTIYADKCRMIQLEPDCAQWDAGITYTLKPGDFHFTNYEFDNAFHVNSLGVRDDEASLEAPEIVFLGDSFTMGWGVEEDECFASLVEHCTGRRTLNTGVSSYGTVRELIMLSRVDRSKLRRLVIQFCNNDYIENRSYVEHDDYLKIATEHQYALQVARNRRRVQYRPFDYCRSLISPTLRRAISWLAGRPVPHYASFKTDEARALVVDQFLHVLETSPVDLRGLDIVVFEVNGYARGCDWFIPLLAKRIAERDDLPRHLKHMQAIDIASQLDPKLDFYRLDGHANARGHAKIARMLLEGIER